ncbi:MAG: hypothetical protein H8E17_03745 [Deltaproteobacteria bacterium]|nr:hypothetical protein [Deltaproteobacteria bacterium]
MPGEFVCSLYYHSIKDNPYRIPFGFISTHLSIVEKIQNRLTQYLNGKIVVDVLDYDKTYRIAELEKDILRLVHGDRPEAQSKKKVVVINK